MSDKTFSVVKFVSDNTVDFVPSKWIIEEDGRLFAPFPRNRNASTDNLKRNPSSQPKSNWRKWEVVLVRGTGK